MAVRQGTAHPPWGTRSRRWTDRRTHECPLHLGLWRGEDSFSGCSIVLQDLNKHPAWGTQAKGTFPS